MNFYIIKMHGTTIKKFSSLSDNYGLRQLIQIFVIVVEMKKSTKSRRHSVVGLNTRT
jgi:hypothetical protein